VSALWWFDFDAERELELWPRPYTPARPSARTPQVLAAARQLFTSGDHLLEDALGPKGRLDPRFSEFEARAWCATPAASARFAAVGAARLPAPDPALLRHIASRRAHAEMGYALPAAFWAAGPHDLVRAGDHGVRGAMGPRAWIAKRGFTSSGRGIRRFVRGLDTDQLVRGDAEWIEASWAWGGLEFAPLLALEAEYSRHAWVSVEGAIEVGRTVLCAVDARGHGAARTRRGTSTQRSTKRSAPRSSAWRGRSRSRVTSGPWESTRSPGNHLRASSCARAARCTAATR